MNILVASKNEMKILGTEHAFKKYFDGVEVKGISVSSDVGDQPINKEIFEGAKNRIKHLKEYAKEKNLDVDFFVAIEAGLENLLGEEWINFNAVVIEDKRGFSSVGMSPGFPIPERYVKEVLEVELSNVFDKIFPSDEIPLAYRGIGGLTKNEITRAEMVEFAIIMALTKFNNGDEWR